MYKILLTTLSVILISTMSMAELKLKLHSDIASSEPQTIFSNNLESNLKLELPTNPTNSPNSEFLKMWMIGAMADVAFPTGDFGDFASTGFSFHVMAGYMVAKSILLKLSVGYQTFGSKDEQEGYESSTHWVPVLLGANYIFNPGQKFMPFIGLALGLYFWNQTVTSPSYSIPGFGEYGGGEISTTSTEFGVAPQVGFYYLISATTLLSVAAEYDIIFTEGSSTSVIAILAGVMFALN